MQSFSILQMGRGSALNKRLFASLLLYHLAMGGSKYKAVYMPQLLQNVKVQIFFFLL